MAGVTPAANAERRSIDAGWITLPAEGPTDLPPEFPLEGERGLTPGQNQECERLWSFWWSSPMALMWSPHDVAGLQRLAEMTVRAAPYLIEKMNKDGYLEEVIIEPAAAMLSEIRQLEDRYGLNPVGRRKLYWRIEGTDLPSKEAGSLAGDKGEAAAEGPPAAGGKSDPRLRVVS